LDETDALFEKRGDVRDGHDRYANMKVNYLLPREMQTEEQTELLRIGTPARLKIRFPSGSVGSSPTSAITIFEPLGRSGLLQAPEYLDTPPSCGDRQMIRRRRCLF
jgi:hypothetical protein